MSFILFLVLVALVIAVGRLLNRLSATEIQVRDLSERLRRMETEVRRNAAEPPASAKAPAPATTATPPVVSMPPPATPVVSPAPPPLPVAAKAAPIPPPSPAPVLSREEPPKRPTAMPEPTPALTQTWREATSEERSKKEASAPSPWPALTLEAFMGVKLFAWLGGLAMFLGIVFFVKYSFEHNWVTPQMRVTIGALVGLGLLAGGLFVPRPKFAVTAQTLCATGIVTLYGVTFGAYAFYHFLGIPLAFGIMAAITALAFILAVRLNAQVVAILGLLGGFLTPLLLSTGQDNPAALFGYITVLDVGLVAVALRQRWHYLVTLGAVATGLMELAWLGSVFTSEKVMTGATIFLGFELFFLLPFWLCKGEKWTTAASAISGAGAFLFAGHLLGFAALGEKPWICLSILLAADAALVVWPLQNPTRQAGPLFAGGAAFLILSAWNVRFLNEALLHWALGYFLVFAAFHTALPLVLRKLRPAAASPRWVQIFPVLGLVLMLWPAFHIGTSLSLWIAVLVADLAAIVLAVLTTSLLGLVGALVLTLIATALWLVQAPVEHPPLGGLLTVIAGFAALFCAASVFLQKRIRSAGSSPSAGLDRDALDHLPAISAAVPFLLLISAMLRLHPANPSSIFAVGMLLVVVILGLARWSQTVALPPVALLCSVLLEYSWHLQSFPAQNNGTMALGWSLGFTAIIFAFPFLFQSRTAPQAIPWATAALAPVLHYPMIHGLVLNHWPDFWHTAGGLVPAALAIPPIAACDYLRRRIPPENSARLAILAWFGGVALLFITLIFPIQFHREWLTLSWALEGAALLWLFHRVPHPGLRTVGFCLLCVAFARLAMNPAVLLYHSRSGTPIWNWYLYTYLLGAGAFSAAGFLSAPPRHRLGEIPLPGLFFSLGTVLLFLLLNIEIADFFATGETLTFDFQGNLARDMSYSIAWSLFALGLLLVGMHRQIAGARYAGIGLLVVTLIKLFLHDLANLDQLYRIGAFIAVAIVLIGASYLYQRFLADEKAERPAEK